MDAAGSTPRRITSEPLDEGMPFWSRDGKWVYFRSNRTGHYEIWRVLLPEDRKSRSREAAGYVAYESIDGQTLFYDQEPFGASFREAPVRRRGAASAALHNQQRLHPRG